MPADNTERDYRLLVAQSIELCNRTRHALTATHELTQTSREIIVNSRVLLARTAHQARGP